MTPTTPAEKDKEIAALNAEIDKTLNAWGKANRRARRWQRIYKKLAEKKDDEIAALKVALEEKNNEITRLTRAVDKLSQEVDRYDCL